jgi:hypothetical protein
MFKAMSILVMVDTLQEMVDSIYHQLEEGHPNEALVIAREVQGQL